MFSLILFEAIVKLIDELAISNLIARVAQCFRVIEVHQSLEVHPEFILSDCHAGEGGSDGPDECGAYACIIKNHNYYLMMMRQALRTRQHLLLPLRFTFANPLFARSSQA